MTKVEHTPGPWKATWNTQLGLWSIHHTQWCERGESSILTRPLTSLNEDLDKANAKLMAAAPELLEALIQTDSDLTDCLEHFESCYDADYQGEETGYVPNDEMRLGVQIEGSIKTAVVAIAKAMGET